MNPRALGTTLIVVGGTCVWVAVGVTDGVGVTSGCDVATAVAATCDTGVEDGSGPGIGEGVGVDLGDTAAGGADVVAGGVTTSAGIVVEVGEGDWAETDAVGLGSELLSEQARPATRRIAKTEAMRSCPLGAKLPGANRVGRNEASNKRGLSYCWPHHAVKDTL